MNKNRIFILTIILSTFFLSACQTSQPKSQSVAETPDPDIVVMPGLNGKNSANSQIGLKPMTFEELSECGTKIDKFRKEVGVLKIEEGKLAVKKAEIDQQLQALENERSKVDTKNSKQVRDFNKRNEQNKYTISLFNAESNAHYNKATTANLFNNEINVSCANRAYRKSDYSRLNPDIIAAIESRSKTSDIPLVEDTSTLKSPLNSKIHIQER